MEPEPRPGVLGTPAAGSTAVTAAGLAVDEPVCHSADIPSRSLLITLLQVQRGVQQNDSLANGAG